MDYYSIAAKTSREFILHPSFETIKALCSKSKKILDVGCGEGTRLSLLCRFKGWGIDNNLQAVKIARKKYPQHIFQVANAEAIPFTDEYFDLVYSTFVLEHTQNPFQAIREMIRVCKKKGYIIIICPNFGAPNRASPNSSRNRLLKLLSGFIADFKYSLVINWEKVIPKPDYDFIDADTTVEPYLGSLIKFLLSFNLKLIKVDSLWQLEAKSFNPRKILFKWLGKLHIFPFKYWGPQLYIIAQKL